MEGFARIILLLLGAALLVNVARRGPRGAADWTRAKFLGQSPQRRAAA